MSDTAPAPKDHNKAPADTLLDDVRKLLRAHSRNSKGAIEELHKFLAAVMKTCEYASQNEENAKDVKRTLFDAGTQPPDEGTWFRTVIAAAFEKKDRDAEKTNITKWASALCYAERQHKTSDDLMSWLKSNSIATLARLEAEVRRSEKAPKAAKVDEKFEAVLSKHRKPIEISGIELAEGSRFGLLVIERTEDRGICQVAQATASEKEIRRYFPELPKRGRKPAR